jgi:hypothetical protein
MPGSLQYNTYNQQSPQGKTWLDELIEANPQGVMSVLDRNGYSGYLAPGGEAELSDAAYDFLDRRGEYAVVELIKVHPLYDVIAGVATEEKMLPLSFRSASGDIPVISTIRSINYKKLIETFLLLVGMRYVLKGIWGFIKGD